MTEQTEKRIHFIRQLIKEQQARGENLDIITRFPPEPNGYLHIGHARSICLNFSLAEEFSGKCNLRFDDTNPLKEEEEYVNAIIEDVKWLGFKWDELTFSSDYYETLYGYAVHLIKQGLAYVDELSMEEIREYRGTLQEPGKPSPYRDRSIDENLELFEKMKQGHYKDGECVLRAKIDMSSGNLNMRDPVLYRVRHATHDRTGDDWCIYPMYDFAHPLSDGIESITHSLCTLEFQDHRPLYDWLIENTPVPGRPVQTEFSRLNLSHTITSKRKLRKLVEENIVSGWDDPRLPTLRGMRKRGYPPQAIKQFCEETGISRSDSITDMSILEECVRKELNKTSYRVLSVFDPLKVVIENYPEDKVEQLEAKYHPQDENSPSRIIPFTKELYIDRNDFMVDPPKKFFRLAPGKEVRLRHAYIIKCEEVIYDDAGNITELRCSYDENTLGRNPEDRKVKGVIHWVSAVENHQVDVYHYDRLFVDPNPSREEDFLQFLNSHSCDKLTAVAEKSLQNASHGDVYQFERVGYYCINEVVDNQVKSVHCVVDLRSAWEKLT